MPRVRKPQATLVHGRVQRSQSRTISGDEALRSSIAAIANANGTVKWSPFAQNGELRDDLFAEKRVNGFLVPNTTTNEGWYLAGAFGEGNGPSEKPSISTDEQMIEQSNWPFESDIMKQDEPFTFQALQNLQPAIARLIKNLPRQKPSPHRCRSHPG